MPPRPPVAQWPPPPSPFCVPLPLRHEEIERVLANGFGFGFGLSFGWTIRLISGQRGSRVGSAAAVGQFGHFERNLYNNL